MVGVAPQVWEGSAVQRGLANNIRMVAEVAPTAGYGRSFIITGSVTIKHVF